MTVYKIEFHKNVPVVEKDGAKWMFDTGVLFPIQILWFLSMEKLPNFLGFLTCA